MENEESSGDWFAEFSRDVVNQWHDFNEFECLYYASEARVALLNEVAKHFFGEMFHSHLDRIVLAVARLTDPPGSGSRQNLSLWAVHERYANLTNYPSHAFGEVARTASVARAHTARWRNKRIAHTDADSAIKGKDLGSVKPLLLREFYVSCGTYVSELSQALGRGIFPIDTVSQYGAEDLVQCLKRAVAYREDSKWDPEHERRILGGSKFANA